MVSVYCPSIEAGSDGNDTYARLLLVSDRDRELLWEGFKGAPVDPAAWTPPLCVRAHTTPGNLTRPLGDRAGIDFNTDPMVLSDRALDVLLPHIGPSGHALRLAFAEAPYSLFNVTRIVDALDLSACDVVRYPDGNLSRIVRYAFHPSRVADEWIFKVPQKRSLTFVTDRFVRLAQAKGLTGFDFEPLWSEDPSPALR